jgi:hypothetical protein
MVASHSYLAENTLKKEEEALLVILNVGKPSLI